RSLPLASPSSECWTQTTGTRSRRAFSTRLPTLATTASRSWFPATTPCCTSMTRSAVFGRFASVVMAVPSPSSSRLCAAKLDWNCPSPGAVASGRRHRPPGAGPRRRQLRVAISGFLLRSRPRLGAVRRAGGQRTMAERKPGKKATQQSAKSTAARGKSSTGFTAEERSAMKERAQELKAAGEKAEGESAVLAKLAEMSESDRAIGKRLHAIVKASAPALSPKLWYGMPAYARDGKIVCFYQPA